MSYILKLVPAKIVTIGSSQNSREQIRLVTGMNEITEKQWQTIQKNKVVLAMLESGVLEFISGPEEFGGKKFITAKDPTAEAPIEVVGDDYSLSTLNGKEAGIIIADTFDIELLKRWSKVETRNGVKKAIETQMDKIQDALKKSKEDENKAS